jgi:hypothetical protein
MLRREQLCPGPGDCPDVLMRNPFADFQEPRCEECPLSLLEDYLGSAAGQLIQQTIDLDFALQSGVSIGLDEITYPEFLRLRLLTEERSRLGEENTRRVTERR